MLLAVGPASMTGCRPFVQVGGVSHQYRWYQEFVDAYWTNLGSSVPWQQRTYRGHAAQGCRNARTGILRQRAP
jgi:hypothetical protein